jgi:hypothetical protein
MKLEAAHIKAQEIQLLKMEEVTKTYNGKDGCACGCGGTYAEAGTKAAQRRLNFINKNLNQPGMLIDVLSSEETCYEFANEEGTRLTRVYVQAVK